jgi:hypothetical protein
MGSMHASHRRRLRQLTITAGAIGAMAPAAAQASVTASVTGDGGAPVPVTPGLVIRNMNVSIGLSYTVGDTANYALSVTGPGGVAVANPRCASSGSTSTPAVDYRGNGAYTATVVPHAANDYDCSKAATGAAQAFTYTVAASVAIAGPPAPVLIRQPNTLTAIPVSLPITLNHGALTTDVTYAAGAVIGPDGAISGPSEAGFVDSTTGTVPLSIRTPGTYTVVARQKGYSTSAGNFYTPWSTPVNVVAVAPFDLESLRLPDSRGPSYQLRGVIREASATGKVKVYLARGSKRGPYRLLGSAKISSKRSFTKRFRHRGTGIYRVKITYGGNGTVVGGFAVSKLRFTRRLVF